MSVDWFIPLDVALTRLQDTHLLDTLALDDLSHPFEFFLSVHNLIQSLEESQDPAL